MSDQEALNIAQKLKRYCEKKKDCAGCPFCAYNGWLCTANTAPLKWELPQSSKDGIEKESANTKSHDEKHILEGCLSLMWELVGSFKEWLEFAADSNGIICLSDIDDPEIAFSHSMYYSDIVRQLFLWRTGHSGGTSTMAKCKLLGVDSSKAVEFNFGEDET